MNNVYPLLVLYEFILVLIYLSLFIGSLSYIYIYIYIYIYAMKYFYEPLLSSVSFLDNAILLISI